MPSKTAVVSDYERQRQEQIAKNKALLLGLQADAATSGLATKRKASAAKSSSAKRTHRAAPKEKTVLPPARTSARIRGIQADSEVAKRKAEEELEDRRVAEKAKRQRVGGDLNVNDILTNGQSWNSTGNFLRGVRGAVPYERTFDVEDGKKINDKALKTCIERLSSLELWQSVEPAAIKITPERVVSPLLIKRRARLTLSLLVLPHVQSDAGQSAGFRWRQAWKPGDL